MGSNTKIVRISPFLKMKAEQLNWTGYDAALVDEATNLGMSLEKENEELKEELSKVYSKNTKEFFRGLGRTIGYGIFTVLAFIILGLMISGISKMDTKDRVTKVAYDEAVIKTISFVEAKYRGIPIENIRVELLQDSNIVNKEYWISDHTGRYSSRDDAMNEYNEIVKKPVYNVFINNQ